MGAAIPTTVSSLCDGVGSAQFVPVPSSPTVRGVTMRVHFVDVAG